MPWIDRIPTAGVLIGLVVIFGVVLWGGYLAGQWRRPDDEATAERRAEPSGAALGAVLTLSGFLLAFTYSLAGSHFDSRRQLVIDESNAVYGVFIGTEFLQEPHRSELQGLLLDYVELRVSIDDFEGNSGDFDEFIDRSEVLLDQMVVEMTAAANLDPSPVVAGVVSGLNTVVDLHEIRTNLRWNRIPPSVFVVLAFLSAMALFLVGYRRGLRQIPGPPSAAILVMTYATVFALVIDLDRHVAGIFAVNQQPMIDLRESLLSLAS